VPWARLMVTTLSSMGWRITSRTGMPNLGTSSRKRTPWCATLISAGRGLEPAPSAVAPSQIVVCHGSRRSRLARLLPRESHAATVLRIQYHRCQS
jgi:hypothetical protein